MKEPEEKDRVDSSLENQAEETEQESAFETLSGLEDDDEEEEPRRDFKGLIGCGG